MSKRKPLDRAARDNTGSTTIRISRATRELVAELRTLVADERRRGRPYWRSGSRYDLRDDDLIYDVIFAALEQRASTSSSTASPATSSTSTRIPPASTSSTAHVATGVVDKRAIAGSSTSYAAAGVVDKRAADHSSTTPRARRRAGKRGG